MTLQVSPIRHALAAWPNLCDFLTKWTPTVHLVNGPLFNVTSIDLYFIRGSRAIAIENRDARHE